MLHAVVLYVCLVAGFPRSTPKFWIQPLLNSDAPKLQAFLEVASLLRRTFNKDANVLSGLAIEAEHVQALVERSTDNILLAARAYDDRLVGFAEVLMPGFLLKKSGAAYPERLCGVLKPYMASLAVEPSWQLCGVGRALVDQAERSAMEAGYSCITLEVEATNTAALALYTSGGYEQVDCDENGRKLVGDVFFGKSKRVCKLTLEKSLE